jgi:hypothetical protein
MAPYRNCICATSVAEAFTGAFQVSSVEANYEDCQNRHSDFFWRDCFDCFEFGDGQTRIEATAAAAAGRVASQMVANAVVVGAERLKGPACHRGADELRLRGVKYAIFVTECWKVL